MPAGPRASRARNLLLAPQLRFAPNSFLATGRQRGTPPRQPAGSRRSGRQDACVRRPSWKEIRLRGLGLPTAVTGLVMNGAIEVITFVMIFIRAGVYDPVTEGPPR